MGKGKLAVLAGLGIIGAASVALFRSRQRLLARLLKLPPPLYRVATERDLRVPAGGGRTLLANHYAPAARRSFPTILIRSPWGRGLERLPFSGLYWLIAQLFAERGYHVVVQDTRIRSNEEGELFPWGEDEDGRAALDWISLQSWFNGQLGTWGASYLGYSQWALAVDAPDFLKAMVPVTTSSNWRSFFYQDGAFALERVVTTLALVRSARLSFAQILRGGKEQEKRYSMAVHHLPLVEADTALTGEEVVSYRQAIRHNSEEDRFWRPIQHRAQLDRVSASVHLMTGWYDVFLRETVKDYSALVAAGRTPFLTVGPYAHTTPELAWESVRQALSWFEANLKGRAALLRQRPVRVYLMGADEWREFDTWPPEGARDEVLWLQGGASLRPASPIGDSLPDHYRYDPLDPTPSIGGALIGSQAGAVDDSALESRSDVLVYTSEPLTAPRSVVGSARLDLFFRSALEDTDVFARLCDVLPSGESMGVCDGFVRLSPGLEKASADGAVRIGVEIGPTAYNFARGHRLRLVIASGAHPRWARNLGVPDREGEATTTCPADQSILHDAAHPSAIILPVLRADGL